MVISLQFNTLNHMKIGYKHKLFIYFTIIFGVFTFGVVVFELSREKKFKTEALEGKLDICAEMIHTALRNNKIGRAHV